MLARLVRRWWRERIRQRQRLDVVEGRIRAMEELLRAFDASIDREIVIHLRRIVTGQIAIERMHATAEAEAIALRRDVQQALGVADVAESDDDVTGMFVG